MSREPELMPIHAERLAIPDIQLLRPSIHRDERGFLFETFRRSELAQLGITCDFVQENHSYSESRGVVRGLHFQIPPHPQAKLVRCIKGSILDVAVDIRSDSSTFGQHVSQVLSADNRVQMWIPVGFAHGFCALEPNTEVVYKISDYYSPAYERGISFDDPGLSIEWPVSRGEMTLSAKDQALPRLTTIECRELL